MNGGPLATPPSARLATPLAAPTGTTPPPPLGGLYRCSRCDFADKCKSSVVQHYSVHAPGAAYQCCLCGDRSDYRNSIYRHIRNRHRRQDYNAIIVEAAIRQPGAQVNTEPLDAAPVVIQAPSSTASQPAALKLTSSPLPPATTTAATPAAATGVLYKCGVCQYTARHSSEVQRHAARQHSGNEHTAAVGHAHSVEVDSSSALRPPTPATLAPHHQHREQDDEDYQMDVDTATVAASTGSIAIGGLRPRLTLAQVQTNRRKKEMSCQLCPFTTRSRDDFMQHSNNHYPQVY